VVLLLVLHWYLKEGLSSGHSQVWPDIGLVGDLYKIVPELTDKL
jgi:hypothetical protein